MAKKEKSKANSQKKKDIYDIAFNERDDRILELEFESRNLEEDIEDAIKAYIKAGGPRKLKGKKKKFTKALDGLR